MRRTGDNHPYRSADARPLVVRAGSLWCALPMADVIEAMRPLPVQQLATTAHFVRGVAVVRGTPTRVIDLAALLEGAERHGVVSRFVTMRAGSGMLALAVSQVVGILNGTVERREQSGPMLDGLAARLVRAVGVLDGAPLLFLHSTHEIANRLWGVDGPTEAPS